MAKKNSKEIIASALLALMKQYPLDVITVSEICDNTILVRKTFYNNFSSKEDVISYIIGRLVSDYLDRVNEGETFSAKEMAYKFFCFGEDNVEVLQLLIRNDLFHLFTRQFIEILPLINVKPENNRYRNLPEERLKYIFAFNATGVVSLLEIWVRGGMKESAEQMAEIYDDLQNFDV